MNSWVMNSVKNVILSEQKYFICVEAENEYDRCSVEKFINYLFHFSEDSSIVQIIVAAHNGDKFDSQFVYSKFLDRPGADDIH